MNNKVAIVTGATRGIGRGIFHGLAAQGVSVATVYHADEKAAAQFSADAAAHGVGHYSECFDIKDFDRLGGFVQAAAQKFGRIDYLVNNIGYDDWRTVWDLPFDAWRHSQDVLLNAPFLLCKHVLPIMRRQQFGRIVNIGAASRDYFKGAVKCAAFGVHKAGLKILTKTLALEEIAHGITVNMVEPGSTQGAGTTPEEKRIPLASIPLGRRVEVEEVVSAVLYLLSDTAVAVTGQALAVNGGLST